MPIFYLVGNYDTTLREHLNSQFLGGYSMFFYLLTVIQSKESSQIF